MKWPPKLVLEGMRTVSWPILTPYFSPNCCVAATRIGIAVLKRFGIDGRVAVTRALAGNKSFAAWIDGGSVGEPPEDARCVDIDLDVRDGTGVPAHLCITGRVQGQHFLLDLSAPQFHRPAKEILVPEPQLVFLPGAWPMEVMGILSGGTVLAYTPHPMPLTIDYERSRDWTVPGPRREVFLSMVGAMIAAIERSVAEQQLEKAGGRTAA